MTPPDGAPLTLVPDNRPAIGIDDLAAALMDGQLTLAYQPKICLASGQMAGVEAFTRWRHPTRGNIPPCDFIPLAERSALIQPFTDWVIATAATDWASWHRKGVAIDIAVNVSAKNLQLDFPDSVVALCRAQGMPNRYLTIELTESAEQGVVALQDTLARLRIKGMKVSLDDFGTGYSSLLQLKRLPLSEIKIDQSFVTHADTCKEARIIIRSTVDLAHELGLSVVAEGVETPEVASLLGKLECDIAQGYHFARPMPAADLLDWTLSRPTWTPEDIRSAMVTAFRLA